MDEKPTSGSTRQKRINRQLTNAFVASAFLGIATAVAALIVSERQGPVAWAIAAAVAAIAVGISVVGFRATMRYWRGIDELARDAHKTAWFWGGSAGLLVSWIPLCVAYAVQGVRTQADPLLAAAMTGAAVVVGAQLLDYGVFWVGFWLRNR